MKKVRCAIYTRKSSEEGLEQDFNSLDAQREACAAYILSQASEGWSLLSEQYDDGGLSGGSLERPALQRLLADLATGRIDIIVVYKVDRLTRSLLDFAKLVEAFDEAGTSFVSVTQSFNTTTSMGRLTLNMLLSFAQFEREVTAERIRDKIAASKAKGMWMGGTPPLGYRPNGRSLAIVEEHAEIVRDIYRRYLTLKNVRLVAQQLAREGITSPERTSGRGRRFGGCEFSRGQLYAILKNPIYVGDVVHRGQTYAGQQPAIIDRATWAQVQEQLAENVRGERRARSVTSSLLAGMIVDEAGEPLVAVHACKGKTRYRYYVSRALQHGGGAGAGVRIPARELETVVTAQIVGLLADPLRLSSQLSSNGTASHLQELRAACQAVSLQLHQNRSIHLLQLLKRICVADDRLDIDVSIQKLAELLGISQGPAGAGDISLSVPIRLSRTGRVLRLVEPGGSALVPAPDSALIRLLLRAHAWWAKLAEGGYDISSLAKEHDVSPAYVTRVVRLAFLAPAVVEAILGGRQRPTLTGGAITATAAISPLWPSQAASFIG